MKRAHRISGTRAFGTSRDFVNMGIGDHIYNFYVEHWSITGYTRQDHHPSSLRRQNLARFQL